MITAEDGYWIEYACGSHCRIELDLNELRPNNTLRQMRAAAHAEHEQRHRPAPEATPIHDSLSASFQAPA